MAYSSGCTVHHGSKVRTARRQELLQANIQFHFIVLNSLSTVKIDLPILLNIIKIIPHEHVQRGLSPRRSINMPREVHLPDNSRYCQVAITHSP